jgi:outer membrane protein assembly factor BamD (BamD/ComL family)
MVLKPLNIQNNYWGANFNPSTDLYPSSVYTYQPVWQLLPGLKESDVAELEYNTAQTYIEQEQYVTAKSILKQIPFNFPGSQFAQASLKRLFELEYFASNNYLELKSFYDSVYLSFSDPEIKKSAYFMSNCCNMKTGLPLSIGLKI